MKLLVLDVEGTVFGATVLPGTSIPSTVWQGIAKALGPEAEREETLTHEIWEAGGYSNYIEWMEATILIHRKYGLTVDAFSSLIQAAEYNAYVRETLVQVDRAKFVPVLVSGGFRELATRAQKELNIKHAFAACEYLFDEDGKLFGYNLLPCDFEGKIDFIRLMVREYRLGARDWIFVGDGKNDVPIAKVAPLSVAYRADPALRQVATHTLEDFRELSRILDSSY